MRDILVQDSRIRHEKRPEYGYARISIDLGDAQYVGTDIPLTFSGDQLAKIKYTGSNTGTYFRLNDRHAQQIYASEFKRSNIPFTKIYLTNPVAQTGKILSFYIGTGVFAAVQPSSQGADSGDLMGITDSAGNTITPSKAEDYQAVNHKLTVAMGRALTATGTCGSPTRVNDNLYTENVQFDADDEDNVFTFIKPVLMKQFRMYGSTTATHNIAGDGRFDIYYWDEAVNDYVLWRYDLPVRQAINWSDWEEVSLVSALKIKIVARIHDSGGVGGSAYREMEFKY